jgi:hypothetical protein
MKFNYNDEFSERVSFIPVSCSSCQTLQRQMQHTKQLHHHKRKIEQAIEQEDVIKLRELSTMQYAFVNNQFRRAIYPLLLQHSFPSVDINQQQQQHTSNQEEEVDINQQQSDDNTTFYDHEYVDQVDKDVCRSLYKYVTDLERSYLRTKLSHLVNKTLCITLEVQQQQQEKESVTTTIQPQYYQGFHELCSVLMLTLGEELSYTLLRYYLIPHKRFLRTALEHRTLEPILNQLKRIYSVLHAIGESEYALYLKACDMDEGHYALSWILTWYCHVIDDLHIAQKILDAIIANGSEFCIYIAASIVLERKREVMYRRRDMDYGDDEHQDDDQSDPLYQRQISPPDFTQVFAILNRIPNEWCNSTNDNDTVWDSVIHRAVQVRQKYERAVDSRSNSHKRSSWVLWAGVAVTIAGVASTIAYYTNPLHI